MNQDGKECGEWYGGNPGHIHFYGDYISGNVVYSGPSDQESHGKDHKDVLPLQRGWGRKW